MKVLNSLKGDQCDHFYSIFKKIHPMDQPDQDSKPSMGKESTPSSKDAPSSTPPKNDKKPPSLEPPGGGDDTSPKAVSSPTTSEKGQNEGNESSGKKLRGGDNSRKGLASRKR